MLLTYTVRQRNQTHEKFMLQASARTFITH